MLLRQTFEKLQTENVDNVDGERWLVRRLALSFHPIETSVGEIFYRQTLYIPQHQSSHSRSDNFDCAGFQELDSRMIESEFY